MLGASSSSQIHIEGKIYKPKTGDYKIRNNKSKKKESNKRMPINE